MVKQAQDLTGQKFGRWTVLSLHHKNKKWRTNFWLCKCECGTIKIVNGNNLTQHKSLSCGCYAREQNSLNHQLCKDKLRTKIYNSWTNMKKRCLDKKNCMYKNYGYRGITICKEWLDDFQNFYNWAIANGVSLELTLDRIDVNGNYEPSNCRWATYSQQANNKTNNHFITYKDKTMSLSDWARELQINYDYLKNKIKKGYTIQYFLKTH